MKLITHRSLLGCSYRNIRSNNSTSQFLSNDNISDSPVMLGGNTRARGYYISTKYILRTLPSIIRDKKTEATEKFNKKTNKSTIQFNRKWATLALKSAAVVAVSVLLLSSYRTPTTDAIFTFSDIKSDEVGTLATIDDVAEAEVVAMVAQMTDMPVPVDKTASIKEELGYEPETLLVAKNQVVATEALTNEDINTHTVAEGDTLASIAAFYLVSEDSIKWANDMSSSRVQVGADLTIPPVSGVIHTVASSDTPESLASKYNANVEDIIAFNDAEVNGLTVGEKIVIPGGEKPEPVAPVRRTYTTPSYASTYQSFNRSYTLLGVRSTGIFRSYYTGYCTWWAAYRAEQLGNYIPGMWGNANTWDNNAARAGRLHSTPVVGAVAQHNRGALGHVMVVEAVSADRTMIKYSDMNGLAGWNRAAVTNNWVPASNYNYIHPGR